MSKARKCVVGGLAGVVLVYGALCGGGYWAMTQPPEEFGRIMSHVPMPLMAVLPFEPLWNTARKGKLEPGDPAPDFVLATHDKRASVRLSDFRGKSPVVLVFGSYT
jgi:hypothetical protein